MLLFKVQTPEQGLSLILSPSRGRPYLHRALNTILIGILSLKFEEKKLFSYEIYNEKIFETLFRYEKYKDISKSVCPPPANRPESFPCCQQLFSTPEKSIFDIWPRTNNIFPIVFGKE